MSASLRGPRRVRAVVEPPAPPPPPRLTPTLAFPAPTPVARVVDAVPPRAAPPASAMPRAVERALQATIRIERGRSGGKIGRGLRGFVLGTVLGGALVFAGLRSEQIRSVRSDIADSIRGMKAAPGEITPVNHTAHPTYLAPEAPAQPTFVPTAPAADAPATRPIPTWDVRDLPRAPRPGQRSTPEGEERRGDEAFLGRPVTTLRAVFRDAPRGAHAL